MAKTPPVVLVLFSNDLDDFLPSIEQERRLIEEALEHYSDTNRLKVVARSSVSVEDIFRLFNRYQGRIALFHFAGHAGGEGLQLNQAFTESVTGYAGGLADLFKREVEDGILQLVFLNGCSTEPQLKGLMAAGVPSVISTRFPIEDQKALHFANQVYRTLAGADQTDPFTKPTSVEQAFRQAMAYLKTLGVEGVDQHRGIKLAGQDKQEAWNWHSTNGSWTLPANVADEHNPFNEYLTRRLIEALPEFSKSANKFLQKANDIPDWESVARVSDKAKEIVAYSFVGILGIQLRKLFAIGKDPDSRDKQNLYLSHAILTAKRALKLVNFTLLSRLWDLQEDKRFEWPESAGKALQNFFEDEFGFDIQGDFDLLLHLAAIFQQQRLELPIPELASIYPQLKSESKLAEACGRLKALQITLDKAQFTLADCYTAERQLTYILEKLAFLASYRMVSIKNITYNEMRNAPPRYLHSYTMLGIDSKRNVNSERVNYVDAPVSTQAILLFKGRYQQNINLFPFLIDLNALMNEAGARICFYSHQSLEDGSLNYQFMEDDSFENISFKGTLKDESEINQLMSDQEQQRAYNLDSVYLQFQEAKKALLPTEDGIEDEDFLSDDEDEFDF